MSNKDAIYLANWIKKNRKSEKTHPVVVGMNPEEWDLIEWALENSPSDTPSGEAAVAEVERLTEALFVARQDAALPFMSPSIGKHRLDVFNEAEQAWQTAIRRLASPSQDHGAVRQPNVDTRRFDELLDAFSECVIKADAVGSANMRNALAAMCTAGVPFPARGVAETKAMVGQVIEAIITDIVRPGTPEVRECCDLAEELRGYAGRLYEILSIPMQGEARG